jgi:hypothetical protein
LEKWSIYFGEPPKGLSSIFARFQIGYVPIQK